MSKIRLLVGVALAVVLTGCINSTTLIKLRPNGSGTVEQTTLVNLAALKSMLPPGSSQTSGPGAVNEADLKRTAEKMGKGVRLLSSTPVKENGFEGVKAIFEFDDINQVQISQDPAMGGSSGPDAPPSTPDNDPVRFKLTRNGDRSTFGEVRVMKAGIRDPIAVQRGVAIYTEVGQRSITIPVEEKYAFAANGHVTVQYVEPSDNGPLTIAETDAVLN